MKKIILSLAFLAFATTASYSQSVNGTLIKDIDVEYVQIVGRAKLFSTKVTINIDFGQRNKLFSTRDTQIIDKDGNLTTFNSMIDALNFMSENGYDFVEAYAITISNQNVYHYLLKKSKP